MKPKRKFLSILFTLGLLLSSCGGNRTSDDSQKVIDDSEHQSITTESSSHKEENPSSQGDENPPSVVDEDEAARYEAGLNSAPWKDNHLYIHFNMRNANDYSKWHVWAWQKYPADNDGKKYDWENEIPDLAGKYISIDLNDPAYVGAERIGFLIVLTSSVGVSGRHWTSDSGGDVMVNLNEAPTRPNGTIHLFANQGSSLTPSFTFSDKELPHNPFEDPDNDTLESVNNIDSSAPSKYPLAPTSPAFKDEAGIGYQIQVSSFADSDGNGFGDIRGITAKLDYLKSLNVDVLWLTPVQLSGSYHGYDTIDYLKIDPRYGTMEDYENLIAEASTRDIKIVMDLVLNHTDLNHDWFKKSASATTEVVDGKTINYRNYYHWRYSKADLQEPWYRYATTNYHYYAKFATSMPELNYDNQETRDAIVDVAKFWLAKGVAGFRIDAVKHIYMKDESTYKPTDILTEDIDPKTNVDYSSNVTKNVHFFREFNARIKEDYPNAFLVGENFDGWDERIKPYYQGMDSQLDFAGYYHFVNNTIYPAAGNQGETNAQGMSATKLPAKYDMYNSERGGRAINSAFTSNHDVERMLNHVQNDRTGAGAFIEEHHTHISASNAASANLKARLYAAATLLQPGLGFIYYGDELGMSGNIATNTASNAPSEAIGTDFHKDRWYRQPMKWSSDPNDASITRYSFQGYEVMWDEYNAQTLQGEKEQSLDSGSMLEYFRAITSLKGNYPLFTRGNLVPISLSGNNHVMSYKIVDGSKYGEVYINFGAGHAAINASGNTLLSFNGASKTSLPGHSILVTSSESGTPINLSYGGEIPPVESSGILSFTDKEVPLLLGLDLYDREEYRIEGITLNKDEVFEFQIIEGENKVSYPKWEGTIEDPPGVPRIGFELGHDTRPGFENYSKDYLTPINAPNEGGDGNSGNWNKYLDGETPGGFKVKQSGTYNIYLRIVDPGWLYIYIQPVN